jgi:hypothetical protein
MAVPAGGVDKRRQSLPAGLLHDYVQRSGMVIIPDLSIFTAKTALHDVLSRQHHRDMLTVRSDYINPIDLCNRLNTYIVPEAAVHGFLTFLFLINGYWMALVLNLPLLAWNAKKYVRIRKAEPLGSKN